MIKILFVCHGNICRSPMAEFVMKKLVRDISSSAKHVTTNSALTAADFEIASAATSTEEIGNPVYPPARRMLASHGIDCSGKTARQMTVADYNHYDYIVLMDQNNLRNLRWILPRDIYERELAQYKDARDSRVGKVSLLMDWAGKNRDVADPWYTGDFNATWQDVNEGCTALLQHILKNS
ncbi:low molecular weight phosphotyrosine protein phosphatase [Fibrobacter succinogenes subsp. succinogenes S85]|uniref:protein-tyrosine-phosphatase n=1 Tax=Fibrobacter succinogenes (strain ATCC 19169 / S85) TaxID=59374 RepID=C9RP66_FIBSS|nr:low molecular weight protein-tyrosine-phosphatase [Fibrobacter succinogenes]ACX74530.1 Protein-tyrosine phosphatase, low molecular weight [Fibrobacter succinogenes subsp. succinogenes S85]ADL25190.1 low molecular weight phosphotyrosine protein phosphatase [Fibrobacter succinogenes subsp. succinogenes S85]